MSSELVIRATQEGAQIALLEDKQLVQFHEERYTDKFNVGDIYLGRVRKVVAGLNAAFVDIGHKKDAFLHYLDLGIQFPSLHAYMDEVRRTGKVPDLDTFSLKPALEKEGKITDVLSRDTEVLVQVGKVPISQKGIRLSSHMTLIGRYLILIPLSDGVSISRRISRAKERARLLTLVKSICPKHFGIIVRTAASGVAASELHKDLNERLATWTQVFNALYKARTGTRLMGEERRANLLFRDLLARDLESLHTDDKQIYGDIQHYVQSSLPEKERLLHLYEGKTPLFEHYGIERQLRSSFGRRLRLAGGGSLIIEQTEALHVIDVNSGKNVREEDQESNALRVNLNAVPELIRQIRLRDLGGIIVIDFIDMSQAEHRSEVYKAMKTSMSKDRTKYSILPLTKFGLMQITRHRVRPPIRMDTQEKCPTCHGSGKVSNLLSVGDLIEKHIDYLFKERNHRGLSVTVHPYLYAYFTKGLLSKLLKWKLRYRRSIHLHMDSAFSVTKYEFKDDRDLVINLD